jgi:thioredoxin reductase (NADPH)
MSKAYDVIIIGGGPAGLSAGLYTARAGLKTLLIEKGMIGGQITNAELVENYPGFPDGISGFDLGDSIHRQATKFGVETVSADVTGVELGGSQKRIKTGEGDYTARAVIIAGGAALQRLGVPREEELTGKGVSYCATCDGAFFRDKAVAVVGGGDSAVEEAILLTRFVSKVIVIHRRDQLRASKIAQERAQANDKIEFMWDTVVDGIIGDERVTGLNVRNVKTNETSTIEVAAVFIYVGQRPNTDYLQGIIPLDQEGRIVTDERMETEVSGVFAAGDIRKHSTRQVITAAGDGATAALSAEKYLSQQG